MYLIYGTIVDTLLSRVEYLWYDVYVVTIIIRASVDWLPWLLSTSTWCMSTSMDKPIIIDLTSPPASKKRKIKRTITEKIRKTKEAPKEELGKSVRVNVVI